MCTTCVSSLVPLAGGSVTGLLTMGAVAGSAAVGSLVGFVKRTPDGPLGRAVDEGRSPSGLEQDGAGSRP
jgi:hypothetical protein